MTTQLPIISSVQVTSFIKGLGSMSKFRLDTEYSGTVPHSERLDIIGRSEKIVSCMISRKVKLKFVFGAIICF